MLGTMHNILMFFVLSFTGTQLQHVKSGAVKTGADLSILTLLLISFVAMVMAPRGH